MFLWKKKVKKTTVITLGILLLAITSSAAGMSGFAGGTLGTRSEVTPDDLASKLLRLHVIANSDSTEDQALKNAVRDEIIRNLESEFEDITDINISREFIRGHLGDIEEMSRGIISSQGKDYSVKACFGRFPFPVKNYGYVVLPAGEYEALRVIIGDGKGANWWCVLFPPLCFVDITHGITKDESRLRLSKVLTPVEMAAIQAASSTEEIPIQVRFKVLEWWQEARGKITNTLKLALTR